jgi:hypothetical protein
MKACSIFTSAGSAFWMFLLIGVASLQDRTEERV